MKKNLQHIDEIRFLVIHMILVNHLLINIYLTKKPIDTSLVDFWFEITSPILSLISGYLFFFKTKDGFHFGRKVKARVHSLLIPYMVWTLAFFFIFFILKEVYFKVFHTTYWFWPIVPLNAKNFLTVFIHPPLINFWYLQNLILIIPFNFIIYYLIKNKYVFFLFLGLVIAVYAFKCCDIYFQARFLPYYLLGCFLGYREQPIPSYKLNGPWSFLILVLMLLLASQTSLFEYTNYLIIVLKMAVALVFIVGVYNLIDSNMDSWPVSYLRNNKAYSFFLFAIHVFLNSLVQRALLRMGLENYLYNKYFALLFNILSFVLVVLLALAIARFLKKRFARFYYFITGR